MKPVDRIEVANCLGECVLWDAVSQAVWWTDIEGCKLFRLDWRTRDLRIFAVPSRLAAFAFVAGRTDLVAAFAEGFALFDPFRGTVGPFLRPGGLGPGLRMNDGRVDRLGRFWAGSMVEARPGPASAELYCVGNGRIEIRERTLTISNGLCWNADGSVCYFADSYQRTIWRYRCDIETGRLFDRQVFAQIDGTSVPDGAVVDADGFLWSAQWGGGKVVRYAPDGRIDRVIMVPVSQPSCVAFGGPGLDLLFVTSARTGLTAPETGAGDVFVYNVGVRGLEECRFKFDGWPKTK